MLSNSEESKPHCCGTLELKDSTIRPHPSARKLSVLFWKIIMQENQSDPTSLLYPLSGKHDNVYHQNVLSPLVFLILFSFQDMNLRTGLSSLCYLKYQIKSAKFIFHFTYPGPAKTFLSPWHQVILFRIKVTQIIIHRLP